jgi:RNA polymerase sigma-70 factor, ECF subfamily
VALLEHVSAYSWCEKSNPDMPRVSESLASAYLSGCASSARPTKAEAEALEALEALLAELVRRGRNAWPKLAVNPEQWMVFLAERSHGQRSSFPHAEDLFLSFACIAGATGATVAFEGAHFTSLPSHLARLDPSADFLNEIEQVLRTKLFVRRQGREAGLSAYRGRGPLGAWFRVTALNESLSLLRTMALAEKQAPQSEALGSVGVPDPEHVLIRTRMTSQMQEILRHVLVELPARERALLRMHFIHGVKFNALARIFKVHTNTVWRWITDARQSILLETQRRMIAQLRLSASEVSSALRLDPAEWTLSLERLLETPKSS